MLAAAKDKGDGGRNLSSVVSVKAPAGALAAGAADKKRKAGDTPSDKKGGKKGRTSAGGRPGKASK